MDISRCYQLAVSFIAIFDRLKTEISKKICWHWTKTSIPTRMRMSSSMLNDKNKTLAKYQNKNSLWTFKILIWDQSTSYICYMFLKKYLLGKMFQNASSLKPLVQLKPNCPGMIIGRSSTKFCFLCRSEIQDGHHRNT